MENFPEGEIAEMEKIYVKRGFSDADAKFIIGILSKNKVRALYGARRSSLCGVGVDRVARHARRSGSSTT